MEALEHVGRWISENESLFSGLAALVALVAIIPAALRPLLRRRAHLSAAARPTPQTARGESPVQARPRIAVLPFEASSPRQDMEEVAEILTKEVTTMLARGRGCEVISSRSSNAFAKRGGTTAEAFDELEALYVVEGQVRGDERRLRVATQLVDSQQDRVVWSDSFEAESERASELPATFASRIASHLALELNRAEVGRSRPDASLQTARDRVLAAQGVLYEEGHTRASYTRAIGLLEQAIDIAPDDAEPYSLIALLIALGHVFGFVDENDAMRDRAFEASRRAIELDDRSSEVLGFVGCAYCDLRQPEKGIPLLERAIESNPSNAQAKAALGTALIGEKRPREGVEALEEALRITPTHKGIAPWSTVLSIGYLGLGRREEARASIDRSLRCDPGFYPAHLTAGIVSMLDGDAIEAERHVREAKRLHPSLDRRTAERLLGPDGASVISAWVEAPSTTG